MKKILIFISLVSVIAMLCLVPVNAAVSDFDNNLVAFYDFNGATPEEQLRDKAPAGTVEDNLTKATEEDIYTFDTAEGTVKIGGPTTNSTLLAKASSDIIQLGDQTIYMRVKLDSPTITEWIPLIDFRIESKNYWGPYLSLKGDAGNPDNSFFAVKFGSSDWTNYYPEVAIFDDWIQVVVTIDEDDGLFCANMWIAPLGDATSWSDYLQVVEDAYFMEMPMDPTACNMRLGGSDPSNASYQTLGNITYDELRIYNTVLNETTILQLSPSGDSVPDAPETSEPVTSDTDTSKESETTPAQKETTNDTEASTESSSADADATTDPTTGNNDSLNVGLIVGIAAAVVVVVVVVAVVLKKKKT